MSRFPTRSLLQAIAIFALGSWAIGCSRETSHGGAGVGFVCSPTIECARGLSCTGGVCALPSGTASCTPAARSCDGSDVVVCNATGQGTNVVEACANGCIDAACIDPVCSLGARRCASSGIEQCSADAAGVQSWQLVTPCPAGCDAASLSCLALSCNPLSVRCSPSDQSVVETCAADGTSWLDQPCPAGNVCQAGACVTPNCTLGAEQCSANGVEACTAVAGGNPAWQLVQACTSGCDAVTLSCIQLACKPLDVRCDPSAPNTIQICSADGSGWNEGGACASGSVCSQGACTSQACAPNAASCNGSTLVVCNAQGTGAASSALCSQGCANGACLQGSCTPGQSQCANGAVQVCAPDGSGFTQTESCGGSACTIVAPGVAACASPVCTPLSRRCGPDGVSLQVCLADGSGWTAPAACDSGATCANGVCTAPPAGCVNGALRCSSSTVQECEGGAWVTLGACFGGCSGGTCSGGSCSSQFTLQIALPACASSSCAPPADGSSTLLAVAGPLVDSGGALLPDGTLVTVAATGGASIAAVDADPTTPGVQARVVSGYADFAFPRAARERDRQHHQPRPRHRQRAGRQQHRLRRKRRARLRRAGKFRLRRRGFHQRRAPRSHRHHRRLAHRSRRRRIAQLSLRHRPRRTARPHLARQRRRLGSRANSAGPGPATIRTRIARRLLERAVGAGAGQRRGICRRRRNPPHPTARRLAGLDCQRRRLGALDPRQRLRRIALLHRAHPRLLRQRHRQSHLGREGCNPTHSPIQRPDRPRGNHAHRQRLERHHRRRPLLPRQRNPQRGRLDLGRCDRLPRRQLERLDRQSIGRILRRTTRGLIERERAKPGRRRRRISALRSRPPRSIEHLVRRGRELRHRRIRRQQHGTFAVCDRARAALRAAPRKACPTARRSSREFFSAAARARSSSTARPPAMPPPAQANRAGPDMPRAILRSRTIPPHFSPTSPDGGVPSISSGPASFTYCAAETSSYAQAYETNGASCNTALNPGCAQTFNACGAAATNFAGGRSLTNVFGSVSYSDNAPCTTSACLATLAACSADTLGWGPAIKETGAGCLDAGCTNTFAHCGNSVTYDSEIASVSGACTTQACINTMTACAAYTTSVPSAALPCDSTNNPACSNTFNICSAYNVTHLDSPYPSANDCAMACPRLQVTQGDCYHCGCTRSNPRPCAMPSCGGATGGCDIACFGGDCGNAGDETGFFSGCSHENSECSADTNCNTDSYNGVSYYDQWCDSDCNVLGDDCDCHYECMQCWDGAAPAGNPACSGGYCNTCKACTGCKTNPGCQTNPGCSTNPGCTMNPGCSTNPGCRTNSGCNTCGGRTGWDGSSCDFTAAGNRCECPSPWQDETQGGRGGGILFVSAAAIDLSAGGSISARGGAPGVSGKPGFAGGSGGSLWVRVGSLKLASGSAVQLDASGAVNAGAGRVRLERAAGDDPVALGRIAPAPYAPAFSLPQAQSISLLAPGAQAISAALIPLASTAATALVEGALPLVAQSISTDGGRTFAAIVPGGPALSFAPTLDLRFRLVFSARPSPSPIARSAGLAWLIQTH